MNSEPSRLDRIESAIEAHDRQIELLFTALSQTNDVQRTMLEAINRLGTTMVDLAQTVDGVSQQHQQLAERQQQLAERQQRFAEEQQQLAERQRETDERFNVLLEEVRFLIRRMDNTDG
ncbi:MAG: hypothetical protein VKJ46_05135 [Leptolyngbyaceae bacterium]|nr:hypothetical protein [Leptolyngbyaceae bacterium]